MQLEPLRERARHVRQELIALALAARDPRTPWFAKLLVAGSVAYALSPIDLIPDFIPVLGLVDDLILIPIALALAVRFIPEPVLADCRRRAGEIASRKPSWAAASIIVAIWIGLIGLGAYLVLAG